MSSSFAKRWAATFPLDRWWRSRHSVAFGSEAHRSMSFVDMRTELEEELLFKQRDRNQKKQKEAADEYELGIWLRPPKARKQSQHELDTDFEEIDLTEFNDEIDEY